MKEYKGTLIYSNCRRPIQRDSLASVKLRSENKVTGPKRAFQSSHSVSGESKTQADHAAERFSASLKNSPDWTKMDTSPLIREMWQSFREDMVHIWKKRDLEPR